MRKRAILWGLCSLLVLIAAASGQKRATPRAASSTAKSSPPGSFPLVAITVSGTRRFAADDVVAASGLRTGQAVSEEDFKQAIQRLGETGAFSNVMYTYQYSSEGAKLELQVADGERFVPARFDNLVWFTDQELMEKLRARVPLFHGELPVSGGLPDQVSDVLQAFLVERNISGHVDYLRAARVEDGPIDAFVYSVTGPAIRIQSVEFSGAEPAELPLLQAVARPLIHQEYVRSILDVQADKVFLPVYLVRGYLKATFGAAQAKVVPSVAAKDSKDSDEEEDTQEVSVQVTIPVTPGPQYKLKAVSWSGNKAFPAPKLDGLLEEKVGQIVNAVQLEQDLEAVTRLYGSRGYVTASVKPQPQLDDAAHTADYDLQVHEGDIYRMGELEIRGLDSKTTARMIEAWKLRGGDPYDSSYPKEFLNATRDLLPNGDWSTSLHESVDHKEKTVDVTFRFNLKSFR